MNIIFFFQAFFLVYALGCLSVYYNEVRSYSLINIYVLLTKAFAVMVHVCLVRVLLILTYSSGAIVGAPAVGDVPVGSAPL